MISDIMTRSKKTKQKTIVIYGAPWCPWCHKVQEYLGEHKIKFKYIDVDKDPKAAEAIVKKSGQTGIPVIEIDKEIIVGFDRERIAKLLKIKE